MKHVQKVVIERNKRTGKIKATVTDADGVTRSATFTGIEIDDVINGHINPTQLAQWKRVTGDDAVDAEVPGAAPTSSAPTSGAQG